MASVIAAFKPPRQGSQSSPLSAGGQQATHRTNGRPVPSGRETLGGRVSPSGSPERTDYTDPALERNQTAPMQEGVVEITCDNGKVYSTICVDGTAMVFERTLKSRFHNALWKGSFDIKEVGADCDWSPRIFNNQLCWTLPPAQYEARSTIQPDEGGLGLRRSSVPSSAYLMSDMRTAFSGMRAGSSAGSFRTAPQSMASGLRRRSEVAESGGGPRSGVSKRPRPTSRGGQRDTGADSAMSLGGRENNVPAVGVATRGANQTAAQGVGTSGGGVADMEVEKQAEGSVGVARQATGLGADPLGRGVGDMEVEEAAEAAPLAAPAPGSIEESVCSGTMRRHNPIRLLFEEYRAAGKEIPVVEYVPLPMDGNAIYIRPRGSGLSDSLNAGKYWGGCQTTNMALRNNETVRSWECSGGRKCVNEKCWYVKRTGKCCTEGFVRAGDGAMECMFCGHPSLNTGPCPAKRYEIQGEREVAHVHVGTHNHDVGQRIDQELMDKFHEAAMEAAAADPKLTAARFIQLSIREKLMERIRSGGEDVPDFASLVKSVQPLARMDRVRRDIAKGRAASGTNARGKYAILEIAKKLGYPFVHKVFLAEQQLQPTSEVPIVFMMSVQGRGSGLHVAREMSVEGGDLYYSPPYLDAQKVTAENEVLTRLSTYNPVQRRMMTIASALIESESQKNMEAFFKELKKCCMRGGVAGGEDGEGFWEAVQPFALDVWKLCLDAADGAPNAYEAVIGGSQGRGVRVQCEMHFRKDQKNAENNLPPDLRPQHKSLVRIWLVSETEEQWGQRFHTLLDWYEAKLGENRVAKKKMTNWAAFWRFRSPGLGVWALPENQAVLEEEYMAVNPTSNLAEVGNAIFWAMVGGKGNYLPRGEVVMNESTSAVLQIARTVEFEETGYTGKGPTMEDLRERGEQRRKYVESERERARRMSSGAIGDVARGAGLATSRFGTGTKTVVRRASLGGKDVGEGVESTHRYDKVRKEVRSGGNSKGGRSEAGGSEDQGEAYYNELAVEIAEGKRRLEDLPVREREKVIDLQRMAAAGGNSGGGEKGGESGGVGLGVADAEEEEEEEGLILRRAKKRVEEKRNLYRTGNVEREGGTAQTEEGENERGGNAEEEMGEEDEDLIRRRAEERVRERSEGRGGENMNEGGEARGTAHRQEEGGERVQGEEAPVGLNGEDKYDEGEWGVCRLKKGDESGCIGVKTGGGKCDTTSFEKTRYHGATGVLVLMKQGFRHFGLQNQQGEYQSTGKKYMSYAKMCIEGPCNTREGLNKSLVDKTVPKKGETVLGLFEGTIVSAAELLWMRAAGWNVDANKNVPLQRVHSDTVSYRGQIKHRGKPPRDDRLTEVENETERQRRQRAESEAKRAERELEKEKKEVEKEMNRRPTERPEGRKVKKLGKVIREMDTRLEQALEMVTTAHVVMFVPKKCLIVTLEEAGDLLETRRCARHKVTIDGAPGCDERCREYMEMKNKTAGTWVHCRHVYAVLRAGLKVFQTTDGEAAGVPLIHQATFSEKEVRSILSVSLDVRSLGGELYELRTE